MSLQLREDRKNPGRYFATLCEYSRKNFIPEKWERLQMTHDVPRMYAYYVQPRPKDRFHTSGELYDVVPLRGTREGKLEKNTEVVPSVLKMPQPGDMKGAVLTRVDARGIPQEDLTFTGKPVVTTWEPYVPGEYFLSLKPSWEDYSSKATNTQFRPDNVVSFNTPDIVGSFKAVEAAPGMFVMVAETPGQKGAELVEGGIAVVHDLVNWKPFMTTNEFLITKEGAERPLFFYERHPGGILEPVGRYLRSKLGGAPEQLTSGSR